MSITSKNPFSGAAFLGRAIFNRVVAIAILLLLLHLQGVAQGGSQTTFARVDESDTWALSFVQDEDDPIAISGVSFYVVVSGSSPSISLTVPGSSWLFDACDTDLDVGTPVVTGTTYKFPISAWRGDDTPQEDDGVYLYVNVDGGLIIAIEDLPGKALLELAKCPTVSTNSDALPQFSGVQAIQVFDTSGCEVLKIDGEDIANVFRHAWQELHSGIYILRARMLDGSNKTIKLLK